jgi:putative transposase
MLMQATMRLKVPYSRQLTETMKEFSKATQHAYDYARNNRIASWKALHQRLYKDMRKSFRLTSQLTCKAIKFALETKRGCRNRKADFSRELAVQYDQRSYTFDFSGNCSLSTLEGRYKTVLYIPEYYLKTYGDWKITGATLSKLGKDLFLNVVVEKEPCSSGICPNGKTIGVDLGISNLATTSEGQFFKGVKHHIAGFQRLRSGLQSKGTKSAERHLRLLKGRQTRFMKDLNHRISKQIAEGMQAGDIVVMENLRGIRTKRRGKELNRLLSNWAFSQLRSFVEYKVIRKGGIFIAVPPHYSSKTCSRCHEIFSERPKKAGFFRCLNCGYSCNADLNAAVNLRDRTDAMRNVLGLFVNQPIVGNHINHSDKPTALAVGS